MLGNFQNLLTDLYDLDVEYDVYDFLTTDAQFAAAVDVGGREIDEKLLIAESDGGADVSLYLHAKLLERLRANDPWAELNEENLADFWVAFEGISHFVHFAWRASVEMPVSLLELELQAEVDKFVATALLLQKQGERVPDGLHHWQFERSRLASDLSDDELERYSRAHYYAGEYCRRLNPAIAEAGRRAEVENELRRFYRLSQRAKLDHIEGRALR